MRPLTVSVPTLDDVATVKALVSVSLPVIVTVPLKDAEEVLP